MDVWEGLEEWWCSPFGRETDLVVARGDTDVVFLVGMVILGQSPVNHAHFLLRGVEHDVLGFEVPVHNAIVVGVDQRF